MEDLRDSQPKREHPSPYGHLPPPPPAGLHHMPPAETPGLHSYPNTHPGAVMPPHWNPTPSPYNENSDQRPPHPDASHHHHHHQHPLQQPPPPQQQQQQQQQPPPPPPPSYPPQHYGPPPPGHPADPAYSRHGSSSAATRSPPSAHPGHYPPPPPGVNGAAAQSPYYPPPPDYRDRPSYGPPEGQSNGTPAPTLHVSTSHEMMSGQPQAGTPIGYGPTSAPPPGAPYGHHWGPTGYDAIYPRRKPVRAAQACDPCRQRKAKCDEGRPTCTHCKDNNLGCTYRDIPPQKNEKHVLAIQDKLDGMATFFETTSDIIKSLPKRLDALFDAHQLLAQRLTTLESGRPAPSATNQDEPPKPSMSRQYTNSDSRTSSPYQAAFSQPNHALRPSNDVSRESKPPETRKPNSSTAASNLLGWPVIKKLIPQNHTVTYILDTESNRGVLRLYGCGEGEDKGDGHDGAASPATSSSSGRHDDESSGSLPSGVWGTGQFLPPSGGSLGGREHLGGLAPNGGLLLDSDAVDRHHQSYLENMYKLHPFLDKRVLRKMIRDFKARYSWDFRYKERVVSGTGIKRKRESSDSPSSMPEEYNPSSQHRGNHRNLHVTPYIEHSMANAIILLVLALGKICAYRDPLPGPVQPSALRTPTPYAVYSDLPMSVSASAPTSPYGGAVNAPANGAGVTSMASNAQGKNSDVIPGLAYFSKAADILGEMSGGVDVTHVQANLLAGLYMGQLGRILPSHWYIRNACMACQTLIQSTPYKEKSITPTRRNLINFAFWSCLQLESDILAEVDLPASRIVDKEGDMLFEKPADLTCYDNEGHDLDRVIVEHRHYSYQITLRRFLNDSLHHIYRNNRDGDKPSKGVINAFTAGLADFRTLLRDWDWDDDDHESSDVNVARLRGKYYGAKYIIHRPALYYALNIVTQQQLNAAARPSGSPATLGSTPDFSSPAMTHQYDHRRLAEVRPPVLQSCEPLEPWIYDASRECIHAAIRSTTAFDKVPPRLVITNIFGTAHAQFGNTLVLAAVFCSPHPQLRPLVEENKLRFLMDRTIKFLQKHEAISPSLGKDAVILQHVQARIFGPQHHHPGSTASSFSSNR